MSLPNETDSVAPAPAPRLQTAPSMPVLRRVSLQEDVAAVSTSLPAPALSKSMHAEALDVCQKLDETLAQGLPDRKNSCDVLTHDGQEYLKRNITEYIEASKWLENYFIAIRESTTVSTKVSLEKEIKELEAELQAKEEIIGSCSSKLAEWGSKLKSMQAAFEATQSSI